MFFFFCLEDRICILTLVELAGTLRVASAFRKYNLVPDVICSSYAFKMRTFLSGPEYDQSSQVNNVSNNDMAHKSLAKGYQSLDSTFAMIDDVSGVIFLFL